MRVQFLLGPAGSGKTWRCLAEIRAELKRSPDGPPLLLLAPKQATFQLERQLLDDPEQPPLAGYSRLQIVSFDRLAHWLLETFATVPDLLDDEGRVMVLRALLAREQPALRVFRATARLPGFARQLSQLLRELQRHQLTPARLARLADRVPAAGPLRDKLHDLHHLLRAYHGWLTANQIQDADQLLDLATQMLRQAPSPISHLPSPISALWLDGFAEMTPQELDLLCAVLPFCRAATLAFCLDEPAAAASPSWLSLWSVVRRTYLDCRHRIAALPGCEVAVTELARDPARSRFAACPELAALEANWSAPVPAVCNRRPELASDTELLVPSPPSDGDCKSPARPVAILPLPAGEGRGEGENVLPSSASSTSPQTPDARPHPLHAAVCANPEAEATFAAREILRHVHAGGRFRDCAVILRTLDHHHAALRRTFARYGIPCFLDRREPVAHHPLAELTRFALRTLALGWQPEDFFGALKTGLVHDRDANIDWLENLALAHGWRGAQWLAPLQVPEARFNLARAEHLRTQLTAPFLNLAEHLVAPSGGKGMEAEGFSPPHFPASIPLPKPVSGAQLAAALRAFWDTLGIETRLQSWDDALARESASPQLAPSLHATVLRQMHEWLDNLERAFPADARAGDLPSPSAASSSTSTPELTTPPDGGCKPPALPLREWLPILEAGLSTLTVGVIPPALDQVLIGTIDRSRNPELRLALILGLNEGVFPAPPTPPVLLTDAEREILSLHDTRLGLDPRAQLAHERYFAYIACTRSRARLVLTCAAASTDGAPLHPSPILTHAQRLCPGLALEPIPAAPDLTAAVHAEDLLAPLLRELSTRRGMADNSTAPTASPPSPPSGERAGVRGQTPLALKDALGQSPALPPHPDPLPLREGRGEGERLLSPNASEPPPQTPDAIPHPLSLHPTFAPLVARLREITAAHTITRLAPAAVAQLYGPDLATSVSKLEQFAECPFKFFVAAGLGAEERKEFEVDHRERGSFIHRLLDEFHLRVAAGRDRERNTLVPPTLEIPQPGRRWRDLTPAAAANLAGRIGEDLLASPEFALFAADDARRFTARTLIASAQRLLAALVGWMPSYAFDPVAVELAFGLGPNPPLPAWRLALASGNTLSLRGRIDRVDLHRDAATGQTFAVIVDYKSSPKKLDPLKVAHGLQLQLLAYLNVLGTRRPEAARAECGVVNAECGMEGSATAPAASSPSPPTGERAGVRGQTPLAPTDVQIHSPALPPHPQSLSPDGGEGGSQRNLEAASPIQPAGVFYAPLHGASSGTAGRAEILAEDEAARRATYQHAGRFDFDHRALLDARPDGTASGQFKLRLNKNGGLIALGSDALPAADFAALLTQTEANLRRLGDAIFAGEVGVAPVRLNAADHACARCDYRPICRFDPWTQPYRTLAKPAAKEEET